MKPIIGVSPLYDEVSESVWILPGYLNLVEENGGIPLILPLTANKETWQPFLSLCDGFIFTGGQDIAPTRYNEKTTDACGEVNQLRDEMEFQLMEEVIVRDKPFLAICRGAQLLNVFFDGTLYQDLMSDNPQTMNLDHHMEAPYNRTQHQVELIENSLLHKILERHYLGVSSYHHQAIKKLGKELKVTALSPDGLAEGVFLPKASFALGVQWHPEFFSATTSVNQAIMKAFFEACERKHS